MNDIGWTLSGATLGRVDNRFTRIRRKLHYLEHPIPPGLNANRLNFRHQSHDA